MDWIVIVDDDEEHRARAASVLRKENIRVTELSSGRELLNYLEGMIPLPDLILLDVLMPELTGLETLKLLRARGEAEQNIPVIFLTGDEELMTETESLSLGAVDFIRKPVLPSVLSLRVKRTIEYTRLRNDLAREVEKKAKENARLTLHVVQTLARAIDAKDTYTNGHSGRVAAYSREIARRLGYDTARQDEIYMMGLLHDVGKIGVPDQIINKTSRLTDEEFAKIKTHPTTGGEILKSIREMPQLAHGARWHHERFDGRGYPDGLKGYEIPEEARIIAVADAYDAMTSNRSYRGAMAQEAVRAELVKGKGTQFDPRMADVMLEMMDEDTEYTLREGGEETAQEALSPEETLKHLEESAVLPKELADLQQLDTDLGVYLCGSVEDYLEAVEIFADSVRAKSDKLEAAFQKGDQETYRILVHSLKSSARTIGAAELSTLAASLEKASKAGDMETIGRETGTLLDSYRALESPLHYHAAQ